jgi:hypothetical protein
MLAGLLVIDGKIGDNESIRHSRFIARDNNLATKMPAFH